MPGSGSTSPDSSQGWEHAQLFDTVQLKQENQRLKERLLRAEQNLRIKDEKIRELTETKTAAKKLYCISKQVLRCMTDNNANDTLPGGNYPNLINAQVINELCDDLQEKVSEWQDQHQLLHDQLEVALLITKEVADHFAPPLSPNSSSTPEGRQAGRKDIIDTMEPAPSPASPIPQLEPVMFSCEHCGAFYSRLGHVCSKLELLGNLGLVPTSKRDAGSLAPEPETYRASSSKEWYRQFAKFVKERNIFAQQPGILRTLITSRLQSDPNNNYAKCEFCKEDFDPKEGMQAHLRIIHGVEYRLGRFACLECGEEFAQNREIVAHRNRCHLQ